MKKINNWDKIKKGQAVINIFSDGSGILSPKLFCGMREGYPLLSDFFDESSKVCLSNRPSTKFYKPDKWYWKLCTTHLLELRCAYGRYYEIEREINSKLQKTWSYTHPKK